jgi:hypothetical protein
MRWIGHALRAEAVAAEHVLIHAVLRLTAATVHIDHAPLDADPHAALAHHVHA